MNGIILGNSNLCQSSLSLFLSIISTLFLNSSFIDCLLIDIFRLECNSRNNRPSNFSLYFLLYPLQVISYDSNRGGVSVITEKGDVTTSNLLIVNANLADSGRYSCSPSNADVSSVRVHVINGKFHSHCYTMRSQIIRTFAKCMLSLHQSFHRLAFSLSAMHIYAEARGQPGNCDNKMSNIVFRNFIMW